MAWSIPAGVGLMQPDESTGISDLDYCLSGREVESELRRLTAGIPLPGRITLGYEREPDFFYSLELEGDLVDVATAKQGSRVVGFATQTIRDRYVEGTPEPVAYLGMARILPGFRRRQISPQAFRMFRELQVSRDITRVFASVVATHSGRHAFPDVPRDGVPGFQPLANVCTLVVPVSSSPFSRLSAQIRQARPEDLEAIVLCLNRNNRRYQYSERWSESDFHCGRRTRGLSTDDFIVARRGGQVVGCAALWDQRGFKQIRIHSYQKTVGLAKPVINRMAGLLGKPKLPEPGMLFEHAFASHLAVDRDDQGLTESLLKSVIGLAARRGDIPNVAIGLPVADPRLPMIRKVLGGMRYDTTLCSVLWPEMISGYDEPRGMFRPEIAVL